VRPVRSRPSRPQPQAKLDSETELAIVISREARDVSADEAETYIFGYVCLNDVSDRATQVDDEGLQYLVRAKSRPTYCPIGPYLTTGVDAMNPRSVDQTERPI